ncbi:nitroreductase family protein [Gracilimonas mengyeensis]|uniref:Nitroreductase n=1 Tax=Gracilimonas mengyeensis TaxID=1302730 RepID=A0A521CYS9_9BACT|nr:nitroreductase family protein [Gracilimonas mengyeensis]SMO63830.1 Nitroreductase [Gracilimonas mengyeensis]
MREAIFIRHTSYKELPVEEMQRQADQFYEKMKGRRTVRDFSDKAVPLEVIEKCLLAAGTAPNGANKQPWHFAVVSDPEVKKKIRMEAEEEERKFYDHRASDEWLEDLEPFNTDANKPFLETAPYLIGIFAQSYTLNENGEKEKNYYVKESVGIATGMLITALHHAGLATLTHTPSPMGFLNEIMERPSHEKPFLLLVVGYPADDVKVPDISKKSLDEIASFI